MGMRRETGARVQMDAWVDAEILMADKTRMFYAHFNICLRIPLLLSSCVPRCHLMSLLLLIIIRFQLLLMSLLCLSLSLSVSNPEGI